MNNFLFGASGDVSSDEEHTTKNINFIDILGNDKIYNTNTTNNNQQDEQNNSNDNDISNNDFSFDNTLPLCNTFALPL